MLLEQGPEEAAGDGVVPAEDDDELVILEQGPGFFVEGSDHPFGIFRDGRRGEGGDAHTKGFGFEDLIVEFNIGRGLEDCLGGGAGAMAVGDAALVGEGEDGGRGGGVFAELLFRGEKGGVVQFHHAPASFSMRAGMRPTICLCGRSWH